MSQEPNANTMETSAPKKKANPMVVGTVVAVLALAAVYKGYSSFVWGQSHVETENAYVTGDLIGISPTVSGTLAELTVKDGDFVKKGQLIARLNDDTSKAELAQAEANLAAIEAQVPQAEASLQYQRLATNAAIQRSKAGLEAQGARTTAAKLQVKLSTDTLRNQIAQSASQLDQVKAQAAQAHAGVSSAEVALQSARQAVVTAERSAEASVASVEAAKAEASRSSKDLERYRQLLSTEAISRQQFDNANAANSAAAANLVSAQRRADAANSQVSQARSAVAQAQAQLTASLRQAEAADKQVDVARAGLNLVRAGATTVDIRGADASSSDRQVDQASAELSTSEAGLQQVVVQEKQVLTSKAQVEQARAAVERAKIHVRDSYLYAPTDGYVVKHSANVGTAINPGQTIVTITRGSDIWVMANFKETQLTNVKEGQEAEIEVDAFPGKRFHGKVLSVLQATGSATTLLPPDNSTGNFTKVVQRVPVKIALDPESVQIRQGMSVVATINTGSNKE